MEGKKFSTPLSDFHIKNGIVYSSFYAGEVTAEKAKAHIRIMKEELKGIPKFLGLVDVSKCHSSINSKEIREALNDPELEEMTTATALVGASALIRIAGNLFIRFSKKTKPINFFGTDAAALKWLEQYK